MLEAHDAGVDGCLMVDLPLEESQHHIELCTTNNIDPVFLISPSTPKTRIKQISDHGKGMLYYVCRNGTTGVKTNLPDDFASHMKKIKSQTKLPVITGFGISNKTMAADALEHADGFVVGSLFVETAHKAKELGLSLSGYIRLRLSNNYLQREIALRGIMSC